MDDTVTVYEARFAGGAVGDGVHDDTAAIQAFFDYTGAHVCGKAELFGHFKISRGIVATAESKHTRYFDCNATFTASQPMDIVLHLQGFSFAVFKGIIEIEGYVRQHETDENRFLTRGCEIGIRLSGCSRTKFDALRAHNLSVFGIDVYGDDGSNSTLVDVGSVRATNCGPLLSDPLARSTASWSNPVHGPVSEDEPLDKPFSNSTGQRTTIDVSSLPPKVVRQTCLAVFGNLLTDGPEDSIDYDSLSIHYIWDYDDDSGRIGIYPWLSDDQTDGELTYFYGAALRVGGSDAGLVNIDQLDATTCSVALLDRAQYGPVAKRIVAQVCGAAYVVGARPGGANIGATITGLYCEGSTFDIVRIADATPGIGVNILGTHAINFTKCRAVSPARGDVRESLTEPHLPGPPLTTKGFRRNINVLSRRLYQDGGWSGNNDADNNRSSIFKIALNERNQVFMRDSLKVQLPEPDVDVNRLWGEDDALRMTFIGSGMNQAPSGIFTFKPPSGWTVNGAAEVAFDGFQGAVMFVARYRFEALEVIVARLSG